MKKSALAWLATQDQQAPPDNEVQMLIQEGEQATALQYVNWLVTTCNGAMPVDLWRTPVPHACAVSPNDMSDICSELISETTCTWDLTP